MKPQTDPKPDSLNEPAPNCSIEFTQNFVRRCYGIECEVRQLACERDQIFAIHGKDGRKSVLRFTNTAEDPAVTNFQTEALRHLNAVNPGLPVPRLILDRNQDAEVGLSLADGRSSIARMITYLPGVPLASVPHRNPEVRASMAESIAQLGRAFRGFFHPAANHELLWDIKHIARLRNYLDFIQDDDTRKLVEQGLDDFERYVKPIELGLRAQVIHNDFNFSNVMIDETRPEITGVLDFGDMVYAPLINDLAVALAYQFSGENDDAFKIIREFTAHYHRVNPLEQQELEILYDLIRARQVITLIITGWRASLYPQNRDYILRNSRTALVGIRRLSELDRDQVAQELTRTCPHQYIPLPNQGLFDSSRH
jgi:hydroxylysine kinase